ncbi:unnamed protein product [Dimorphilus gyrociliatus]|uniref:RING-type domain-containing protein n=1 Tax=Dimorphilus gyrociliatus TaxID=2664684 RepID=A0A7I8VE04_9ANNE|nr:unnamed protein product [Dimorphilus gyrociliatus]
MEADNKSNCPICTSCLQEKNSRFLPCNSHHKVCLQCLNHLAKFIRVGYEFCCPICQTSIIWPEKGVSSFKGSLRNGKLIKEHESYNYRHEEDGINDCFTKDFKEGLSRELISIREDEVKELDKLENQVNDIISIIKKERNILKDELETFYANKKMKIKQLIEKAEIFSSYPKLERFKNEDEVLEWKIKQMKTKLLKARKETLGEKAFFKPVFSKDTLEIGRILSPYSDQPTYEYSTLFKGFICQSLSSPNDKHYALVASGNTDRLYDVESGEKLIKFNAKVTSASLDNNDHLYIMIKCESDEFSIGKINTKSKKIEWFYVQDKITIYFIETDWIKNNICFIENNNFWIYDDRDKTLKYRQFNQTICDFKVSKENIYILFHDKTIECLETSTGLVRNYDIETGNKDFSIRLDIINKLVKGSVLLSNSTGIYVVSPKTDTAIFYRHERIFNYGRILSYSLTNTEIIFSIRTYLSMEKLILAHYKL